MRKVLVVIWSDLYIRNYLETGVLDSMRGNSELYFAMRSNVTVKTDIRERYSNIVGYQRDEWYESQGRLIFDVFMLRFVSKSRSFEYRARWHLPTLLESIKLGWGVKRIVRSFFYRLWLLFLSSRIIFPLFKRIIVDRLPENPHLARVVEELKPDLVMFPSSGYSIDSIELVKLCRKRSIPTVCLIDNWDNLSSKSILWERPDHITVWGEQSKEHAIDIQGFAAGAVSVLGTPRFESYLPARKASLPSHFPYPYALFVGTSLPFDEARALQLLNRELEDHPEIYGHLKIVYRPHPWRLGKDTILGMDLKRVVIDPQMAENYGKGKLTKSFQPSLDYYPALLSNAAFSIGGISSMLIESVVFAKRYLVIAYDEPHNLHSPKNIWEYHVHFRGLEHVSGLTFCENIAELPALFRKVSDEAKTPIDLATVDREREYFLHMDDRPYADRLKELVDRLVA